MPPSPAPPPSLSIPLGRFLLDDVVGSGGAGIVWRARHQKLELPVAVKVLPPKADRLALHAHKNEVQAVARLHHPSVIALLDAGVVDDSAAQWAHRANADIAAGSPWLAVELASGGDMSSLYAPFEWPVISDVLRTLLGALAHAHARGVVHKDIKPQNILLCTKDDVRPGLKLTDFGLALAGERADRIDGGTPLFMAPEQFDAEGRDLGPGTDLYALGCVAYWLATGQPPFVDGSWRMLAARHVEERPAPLPVSLDLPSTFSAWVLRMLEKNPAKRYRCAADADAALAQIDPNRPAPPVDRLPAGLEDALLAASVLAKDAPKKVDPNDNTVVKQGAATEILPTREELAIRVHSIAGQPPQDPRDPGPRASASSATPKKITTLPPRETLSDEADAFENATSTNNKTKSSSGTQPPPLDVGAAAPPHTWRSAAPPVVDLRLVEAGLSLWGVRPVPLVGREQERDLLWDALLSVHERRAPRVVVVRGPSGVGKSRLAEWLCHRALETGAALVLRATFEAIPGRADGLVAMVARHAQLEADTSSTGGNTVVVQGAVLASGSRRAEEINDDGALIEDKATRAQASAWLQRWLPGADVTAEELCALAGRRDGLFASGDERQGALVRLLSARARERPLIVWIDDVQHGRDALQLMARVIADAPELAALFVVTAVDELLDDDARARIDKLMESAACSQIELAPLEETAHDELCGRLLGGEAKGLADELRRRTEGNPLFAVHLVGDWIARGFLEVTDDGLALRKGASSPELPDAMHVLWASRIDNALPEEMARRAVEVAAVLGSTVDFVEWEAAVREAAVGNDPLTLWLRRDDVLDDVIDAIASAGLARRTEAGFSFAHSMVRGSVERRAREAGRLAKHHASAASALQSLWGTDTPTVAARMGRHLLAAGVPLQALSALLVAARAAVLEGDVLESSAILADWDRARELVGLPDDDPRIGPGLILRAQVAGHEGAHDESRSLANRAALVARDDKKRAEALRVEAAACIQLALLDDAADLYDEARVLSTRAEDKLGAALALRGLGDVAYFRGDMEAAFARYTAVSKVFAEHGKKGDLVASLWSLGYVEMHRGSLSEAKRLFLEQRKISKAIRDRLGEANAENSLGELARREEKLDEAEAHYRNAARIASKSGLSRRWTFRLNLAHVRVVRGDVANARALASELLSSNAAKEPLVAASAWWILACDAAVRADLPAFDRALTAALEIGKSGIVEMDMATVAKRAGDLVAVHDRSRAEKAWAFANEKLKQLGK